MKPHHLTPDVRAALVEFLNALTGEPIVQQLTIDTSAPPPIPSADRATRRRRPPADAGADGT